MRICETENKMIKDGHNTDFYWEGLADGKFVINSSKEKVKSHLKYIDWHKKHGYDIIGNDRIIELIKNILENQSNN